MARLFSGSHDVVVSSTASMPKAAADRKIAPMFVVSVTPSITTMRRAFLQMSSTLPGTGRFMAHSTPLVSVYPVSERSSSLLPVYTGMSPHRLMMSAASPVMCLRSHKSDTGQYPASSATFITLGLSAMNIPFSGSIRLRNCASVSVPNISAPGCSSDVISIIGMFSCIFRQPSCFVADGVPFYFMFVL